MNTEAKLSNKSMKLSGRKEEEVHAVGNKSTTNSNNAESSTPRLGEPDYVEDDFGDVIEPNLIVPEGRNLEVIDAPAELHGKQCGAPEPLGIDQILLDAQQREMEYRSTQEGYGWYFKENEGGYYGYKPMSPRDLGPKNDLSTNSRKVKEDEINPALLCDNAKTSKTLLIFIVMLSLALLTLSVWQILISKCWVTELCEANDRSTDLGASYLFKTFDFRVPTSLVWANLLGATLGMLIASMLAFLVLRKSVGSARMVQTSTIMRKASVLFLGQQFIAYFIPGLLFFILYGVTVNWETAGAFGIGVLLSIAALFITRTMGHRGSIRASAASHEGCIRGVLLSFRVSVIMSLSVIGISLFGTSSVYLMFSDVRALGGLVAGAATSGLFFSFSGSLFGISLHVCEADTKREQCRFGKKTVGDLLASFVQRSGVTGPQWFETNVSSITAAAVLASSLPFFYRDSFAMCVYNHLRIDQKCGSFGKAPNLSFAVFICRNENLYLSYPNLPTWASNSAFVAVPFLLAVVGLLTSIICARLAKFKDVGVQESNVQAGQLRKVLGFNAFIGCGILVTSFAAICFGLFGPTSSFYSQKGFGSERDLQRMMLDGSENACTPKSLTLKYLNSPLPVPSGGQIGAGQYQPVTASGRSLGPASSTAWRLFLCCLIGLFAGIALSGFCGLYFVSNSFKPAVDLHKAWKSGKKDLLIRCFRNGVLCSIVGGSVVFAAIISSFSLYDAFGVGVMAMSYMSLSGVVCTASALGAVGHDAQGISRIASRARAKRNGGVFEGVVIEAASCGAAFLEGGSVLTGFTLILATLQQAGLQLSPRDLVGGQEQPPSKLISSFELPTFDVLMVCGLVIGMFLPATIAGLLYVVTKQQSVLKVKGLEATSVRVIGRLSLQESLVPVATAFAAPFAVGFGLGNRALIAMTVSAVFTSFVLGIVLLTAGYGIQTGYMSGCIKRKRARRDMETFAMSLCEVVVPAMRSVSKIFVALSLVSVTLMSSGGSQGWIGGVILASAIVAVCIYALWRRHQNKSAHVRGCLPQYEPGSSPKSPYYVDLPACSPHFVVPGSQMSDALDAFGRPKLPVSPRMLPGLSRRSRAEFTSISLTPLASPRIGNASALSSIILRDEVGRTPKAPK